MFTFWMAEKFLALGLWKVIINCLIFHLLKEILPAIRSTADEIYIFQQNNARQTTELLRCKTRIYCFQHVAAHQPGFKPVDYCIWGEMQERVYYMLIKDMAELRRMLMSMWAGFLQRVVYDAIDQWQKKTRCLCSCTVISNIACRVIHAWFIKRVESVTFLTSLYCCKLMK